jgi:hypothetical protein
MSSEIQGRINRAKAYLDVREQTAEGVHELVSQILGRSGCWTCGRLAILELAFGDDPAPDVRGVKVLGYLET